MCLSGAGKTGREAGPSGGAWASEEEVGLGASMEPAGQHCGVEARDLLSQSTIHLGPSPQLPASTQLHP